MFRKTAVLILVLLLVAQWTIPSIAMAADSGQGEKQMRVIATTLNVRSGPGTTNSIIASLPKGSLVTLAEDQGDWLQIRLEDGTLGWAAAKFLEASEPAEDVPVYGSAETPAATSGAAEASSASTEGNGGGGSPVRGVLKWGSLVGAAVFGGLALSEHSKGDDAYDEYKQLFNDNRQDEAEVKYQDAKDHDDKAQTYAIVGGSLFGLFLLQQFVFKGGAGDRAGLETAQPALAWNPSTGEMRAAVAVRF